MAEVRAAYDGSTPLFRALRRFGWGPLLNLGYFRPLELPLVAAGVASAQRRLAREAIRLLDARAGQDVLDVACGRGWTTARIAEGGARVVGVDLLEEHVRDARKQFGSLPGLEFRRGDARALEFADATFERILCLEAGFHFGPEGRARFLGEAFRVLRPGGRLALVDLVWAGDDPGEIERLDPERLVRDAWRFEEFEPLERYRERARAAGFEIRAERDWTHPVLRRFQLLGDLVTNAAVHRGSRALLCLVRPSFREVPLEDWIEVRRVVRAHSAVRSRTRYVAFVLEKPRA